ncbi:MAG: ABC transporter ATP-binding protein, partial [Dehalococcoidia bacterium]|nr:ABC transporter ATP-binding protein [Dehalococcoidia bacterium]
MSSAIEIANLTKDFGGLKAVNELSLQVPQGSIFGFLGPNGAGKTTTIKVLLGLLKPTGGGARVCGFDVVTQGLKVRQSVGYVSETDTMYGWMTAHQLASFCKSLYPRWNDDLVKRYIEAFGLPTGRKVKHFSKGMKAQLALTLALGPDPQVLILDEPTSGMDPLARNEFLNHIVKEVAESGRTIFFSSHILSEVQKVADSVAIVYRGKLLVSDEI